MAASAGRKVFCITMAIALLLCGCDRSAKPVSDGPQYTDPPAPTTQEQTLSFCVVPAMTPTKVVQRYRPLIELLCDRLKQAHEPDLQLVVARDHDDFNRRLAARSFSIAVVSSATAVKCETMGYAPFAKVKGDDKFFGALLVPKTSTIHQLSDLRGKRISFPNRSVMSGSLMVRMFLHDHGLDSDRDYQAIYCESYDSAVLTLSQGRSDVAAIGSGPWALLQRDRPDLSQSLEVRFQTESLPQLIMIAAPTTPAEVVLTVRDAIFHLSDSAPGRAALNAENVEGFMPIDEATLVPVRQFIARYEAAFGRGDF